MIPPKLMQVLSLPNHPQTYTRRVFGRVLHEHEVFGKSLLERQQNLPLWPALPERAVGIPSVEKAMTDNGWNFCPFTDDWQRFSYALILMRVKEVFHGSLQEQETKARQIFYSGWRDDGFATNKFGTRTCRDIINGNNLDKEYMKMECIPTGGNKIELLSDPFQYKGATVYKVRCFDGSKPPPDPAVVNWHTAPHLIHMATIETRIATPDGKRETRPFEFQGVSGFPCFQIVHGRGYYLFGVDRVSLI